jgi:hypothetical protein
MASERQIAANRRNAQKSTGPKSVQGKKRSSKNAYRHGLSVAVSSIERDVQLDKLSRHFAEDATNPDILALAKRAAEADLELARINRTQNAMIERALMQAESCTDSSHSHMQDPQLSDDVSHILAKLTKIDPYKKMGRGRPRPRDSQDRFYQGPRARRGIAVLSGLEPRR